MMHTQKQKGFTLIELIMVIVLIGIVAATAVMVIGNIVTQQQFDATVKEMNELKMAMVGNPDLVAGNVRSSFGYAGDMGALSGSLNDLVVNPSTCSWTADTALGGGANLGTGAGWNGPYIDNKQDDALKYLALLDGWGRDYQYPLLGAGQITSYGADGVAGGTGAAADIVVSVGTTVTGTVSGRVTNPNGGPIQAPPATNNVIIYGPPLTCPSTFTEYPAATDANGYYAVTGVPIGKHKLSVKMTVGVVTTFIDRAVTVLPGATTNMDVVSATTPDITDVTTFTATPFSTSQIRLDWSPPVTTNTDGSTIRDLKGYNIYRGPALNPTSLYASLQNSQTAGTVSYVDSNAVYFNTYYYRITALNTSGIESSYSSANASAPGGYGTDPALQTAAVTGWGTTTITFSIIVNQTITVTDMNVCWTGGPTRWRRVWIDGVQKYNQNFNNNCTASTGGQFTDTTLNAGTIHTVTILFSGGSGVINYTNIPYVRFIAGATTYQIGDVNNGLQ